MKKKRQKNMLRRIRRQLDLTQTELCLMVKTKQQYISDWELGKYSPSQEMKERLSVALGFSVEVVFPTDTDRPGQGVGNEKHRGY